VIFSTAPIAFVASVIAVRRNGYGPVSLSALALSTLEFLFLVGIVLLLALF
jgi:hypothetical protein